MFDHGVQDREQLAHAGRQGDLGGFPGGPQPLVERLEDGVMAHGGQRAHVRDRTYVRPSCAAASRL
jgi:hypothetical protein